MAHTSLSETEVLPLIQKYATSSGCGNVILTNDEHPVIMLDNINRDLRNDPCIFDGSADEDALKILSFYITHPTRFEFELSFQLSRLLAKKGHLVYSKMKKLIDGMDWSRFDAPTLLLSFIVNMPDFQHRLRELLFVVQEDFRDGLFISCMDTSDESALKVLLQAFIRWISLKTWDGQGTGEYYWLRFYAIKWERISSCVEVKVIDDFLSKSS